MFKPGDMVVHRTLGAGIVMSVEEKMIDGVTHQFLRIKLKLKEGDILIPCNEASCAELRTAVTEIQVSQIEKILQTKTSRKSGVVLLPEEVVSPEDLVNSYDPINIARAIRLLEDESRGLEFSPAHRELLATARTALAGELMQVKGISRAAAFTFITRALKAGDLAAKERKKKLK